MLLDRCAKTVHQIMIHSPFSYQLNSLCRCCVQVCAPACSRPPSTLPPRSSQTPLLAVRVTRTLSDPAREFRSPGSVGKKNGMEAPGTGEWLDGSTQQGRFLEYARIQRGKNDQLWNLNDACFTSKHTRMYLWELWDASTGIVIGHYASP